LDWVRTGVALLSAIQHNTDWEPLSRDPVGMGLILVKRDSCLTTKSVK